VAVSRRSARPRFTLLLLVLTAITLLTLDARGSGPIRSIREASRDAFAPVTRAANDALRPVGDFFDGAFHYGDLKQENARLREQLAERRGTELEAAAAQRELKTLLDQAQLEFLGDIPRVTARVVGVSPSNFQLTVTINRGRNSGVAVGMPVVAGAGLVGRVVEASRTQASVLLADDPTFNVGVRLADDVGVATGRGAGTPVRVDLIEPQTKLDRDMVAVTSGLQQSVFPPGIPVGRVVRARAEPGALQQDVDIAPVVDLRRLIFVKVLQWSPKS
jgi:rod shape-determining protein MreC